MVTRFGMIRDVGTVSLETESAPFLGDAADYREPGRYAQTTAAAIDGAVKALVDEALATALRLLGARRPALDAVARRLLERETLSGTELAKLAAEAQASAGVEAAAGETASARSVAVRE